MGEPGEHSSPSQETSRGLGYACWATEEGTYQMEVIVGDFGIVVVPRDAADTDRIMNHSSILRKYKNNIMVVKDDINHPMSVVSSTKSRLALQHGDGHVVDYLSQPVIDYILKSQLYINTSG
ncbi:hypothetical protein J1605_018823 [Eschrichtius robustus]|uniref:Uncharacterized protein n=1 Tax=Eschrichtius robustus TaxID=9764 RepID=A0AB34HUL1_ESCRO|nr:hypothetical protein J1605_018823 [Eschrichtius robustus]